MAATRSCASPRSPRKKGIETLECPVTGGVHLAAAGKITALVGGDAALYERHRSAIEAMCAKSFLMGPIGSAAVIKVITNMLAFIHLVAAGEALMLAKQGGLDLAQAFHAIAASSGTSFVHETESQLVLNGSYDIGFTMDLALKDLGFAKAMGEQFGAPLEVASHVQEIFERGKAAYGGDAWSTQIVKLLEDATGTDLRAAGFPAKLELVRSPETLFSSGSWPAVRILDRRLLTQRLKRAATGFKIIPPVIEFRPQNRVSFRAASGTHFLRLLPVNPAFHRGSTLSPAAWRA